ncbi:antitoxin Xre/MbcA/ParS toxin-binding domain-containing protein [Qipengyuania gelatinilytica]|uniref:DUF2384 domain-containing protein n=1 Tax=Qipengyuania gelatinilytica TaxID=2867231 RepID=A0ABX9A3K7_9SPHN|nr:antitoxin Xre/MbcA/ParS toxin-binding domain-containing protein [Qipengyuania gelatinilytica]QZD95855.1 DUF2384 domain-containing protein [Qipengyuania gelatinilytica]
MSDRDRGTRLTPAAAKRESETTRLAMIILGREAAIFFMNEPNSQLGGRPIDLVIESEEGRERVEVELAEIEYLQAVAKKE